MGMEVLAEGVGSNCDDGCFWRVMVVFGATILDFIRCRADRWASLWLLTGQYPRIATQQDRQDFRMQDPWEFFLQPLLFTPTHLETWTDVAPLGGNSGGLGDCSNVPNV